MEGKSAEYRALLPSGAKLNSIYFRFPLIKSLELERA